MNSEIKEYLGCGLFAFILILIFAWYWHDSNVKEEKISSAKIAEHLKDSLNEKRKGQLVEEFKEKISHENNSIILDLSMFSYEIENKLNTTDRKGLIKISYTVADIFYMDTLMYARLSADDETFIIKIKNSQIPLIKEFDDNSSDDIYILLCNIHFSKSGYKISAETDCYDDEHTAYIDIGKSNNIIRGDLINIYKHIN